MGNNFNVYCKNNGGDIPLTSFILNQMEIATPDEIRLAAMNFKHKNRRIPMFIGCHDEYRKVLLLKGEIDNVILPVYDEIRYVENKIIIENNKVGNVREIYKDLSEEHKSGFMSDYEICVSAGKENHVYLTE